VGKTWRRFPFVTQTRRSYRFEHHSEEQAALGQLN
jgi:hypothetical protein